MEVLTGHSLLTYRRRRIRVRVHLATRRCQGDGLEDGESYVSPEGVMLYT